MAMKSILSRPSLNFGQRVKKKFSMQNPRLKSVSISPMKKASPSDNATPGSGKPELNALPAVVLNSKSPAKTALGSAIM